MGYFACPNQVAVVASGWFENQVQPYSGLTAYYDIEEGGGATTRDKLNLNFPGV
jgi:hypothetical protein